MTVPIPTLATDGPPGVATLEKPVNLNFTGVLNADDSAFDLASLGAATCLAFREKASGAAAEVWNRDAKAWQAGDATGLRGETLAFRDGVWTGILVAAGKQDRNGAPQFEKAAGGFPRYAFAGAFVDKGGSGTVGAKCPPVTFVSASDGNLIGLAPKDGETPESATQARLFLKSDPSRLIGQVRIEEDATLAVETFDGSGAPVASIVLAPDGTIRLRGKLIVEGDVEIGHVSYLGTGGVRKVLS